MTLFLSGGSFLQTYYFPVFGAISSQSTLQGRRRRSDNGCFVTKIVLTYCEKKNVLVIKKNYIIGPAPAFDQYRGPRLLKVL